MRRIVAIGFVAVWVVLLALTLLSRLYVFGYQRAGDGFFVGYDGIAIGHISTETEPEYSRPGWFWKQRARASSVRLEFGGYFKASWFSAPLLPMFLAASLPIAALALIRVRAFLRRPRPSETAGQSN